MRALKYEVILPPNPPGDYTFGNKPLIYVGTICFNYDGFSGPIYWINQMKGIFHPPQPNDVTGFDYILKPGVKIKWSIVLNPVGHAQGWSIGGNKISPIKGKLPPF